MGHLPKIIPVHGMDRSYGNKGHFKAGRASSFRLRGDDDPGRFFGAEIKLVRPSTMSKPRVLVVYKESTYSRYGSSENLVRGFKKNKYWKVLKRSHERHNQTLDGVRDCLRSKGFEVITVLRSRVQRLGNVDKRFRFVVSVGGDGT